MVHSKRSIDEVKLDISRFRRGGLDVLWNCEKLTEVRHCFCVAHCIYRCCTAGLYSGVTNTALQGSQTCLCN